MTDTLTRQSPRTAAPTAPSPRPQPAPDGVRLADHPKARVVGQSVSLLAAFLIGFAVFLVALSGVAASRTQDNLYKSFRQRLALTTAPLGPVPVDTPVALLDVPAIGISQVVVEGTTGAALTHGPGHRRDTVLPGQAGVSVLLGRRVGFGGPFQRLPDLHPGDRISSTTGQGIATYRVLRVRDSRQPVTFVPSAEPNRLVLVTSAPPLTPAYNVIVDAVLIGKPAPSAGGRLPIPTTEQSLGIDTAAVLPLALWAQVLLLSVTATTWLYARWSRWPAYLVTSPVLFAVLWNVYENAARLLPNTF
jgi:sortase A